MCVKVGRCACFKGCQKRIVTLSKSTICIEGKQAETMFLSLILSGYCPVSVCVCVCVFCRGPAHSLVQSAAYPSPLHLLRDADRLRCTTTALSQRFEDCVCVCVLWQPPPLLLSDPKGHLRSPWTLLQSPSALSNQ